MAPPIFWGYGLTRYDFPSAPWTRVSHRSVSRESQREIALVWAPSGPLTTNKFTNAWLGRPHEVMTVDHAILVNIHFIEDLVSGGDKVQSLLQSSQ